MVKFLMAKLKNRRVMAYQDPESKEFHFIFTILRDGKPDETKLRLTQEAAHAVVELIVCLENQSSSEPVADTEERPDTDA